MLAVTLKILSIIGIVLLALLVLVLFLLLLILFFPVSYRLFGSKSEDEIHFLIHVKWLFGLFRVNFQYPKPGKPIVKLLCFPLFQKADSKEKPTSAKTQDVSDRQKTPEDLVRTDAEGSKEKTSETREEEEAASKSGEKPQLFQKYEKIKYTICKLYDRIKYIWENIHFYKELLLEEDTKALFSHALSRLGKILRRIKPKYIMADIHFGTGEPDTTGYLLGVYGIFSPHIKKPGYVNLTPDFEQAVFEGRIKAKGSIRIFTLLGNALLLLTDRRLRSLYHKLKKHSAASKLQQ